MKQAFWKEAQRRIDENSKLMHTKDWKRVISRPLVLAGLQFWKIGLVISGTLSLIVFLLLHEAFIAIGKGLLLL